MLNFQGTILIFSSISIFYLFACPLDFFFHMGCTDKNGMTQSFEVEIIIGLTCRDSVAPAGFPPRGMTRPNQLLDNRRINRNTEYESWNYY